MFNTLKYVKILEDIGIPRNQAEAHISIMTEIIETNLATKQDIQELRVATTYDLQNIKAEFQSFKVEIENKITQAEYRLTIKLGTIVSIAIGVAVTLAKLV